MFFFTLGYLLKFFLHVTKPHESLSSFYYKAHTHSSHLNVVRDSRNSDFADATIANEDVKHFDVKILF